MNVAEPMNFLPLNKGHLDSLCVPMDRIRCERPFHSILKTIDSKHSPHTICYAMINRTHTVGVYWAVVSLIWLKLFHIFSLSISLSWTLSGERRKQQQKRRCKQRKKIKYNINSVVIIGNCCLNLKNSITLLSLRGDFKILQLLRHRAYRHRGHVIDVPMQLWFICPSSSTTTLLLLFFLFAPTAFWCDGSVCLCLFDMLYVKTYSKIHTLSLSLPFASTTKLFCERENLPYIHRWWIYVANVCARECDRAYMLIYAHIRL